jgi:hypothetical protein
MLKKMGLYVLVIMIIAAFSAPAAFAVGPTGRAGKSPIGHLYLFQKDPQTWEIVKGGPWGKMKYRLWGPKFWFVFNGHGLEPGLDYTLIYYPDPWPGEGLICLGTATANDDGNVHIKARVDDTCDLPAEFDENAECGGGAKIWLVLSDDVDCGDISGEPKMIGWNPDAYLFEYDLIRFDETDDSGCVAPVVEE